VQYFWNFSCGERLADELECQPRCPSPDQHAERQFRGRVASQVRPRPPHQRHEENGGQSPCPEDVHETHRRAGDTGGVEREVRQGREEREGQRRERVGEEGGPQRSGSAEEGDDQEGPRVQRRDDAQGSHPFGPRDVARVADLARARQVCEVDEREPARQEQAE
jgi:hypothetical protein